MASEREPDQDEIEDQQPEADDDAPLDEAMPDVEANNSVSSEHPDPD